MLIGLTHVAIAVQDLDASLAFYKKIPGIEEKFRLLFDDGTVRLVLLEVAPRQFLELFPGAKSPYQASTSAGPMHICLEVDDIHAMHRQILQHGIQPDADPRMGADHSMQFWINDPDGNPIEFHQFTKDSVQTKA